MKIHMAVQRPQSPVAKKQATSAGMAMMRP